MQRRKFLGLGAAVGAASLVGVPAAAATDPEAVVRKYVGRGVAAGFPAFGCGAVVGGWSVTGGPAGVDGRTVFQLGSVTKTFTALGLALSGMRIDDPVTRHVPWQVPELAGRPVTMVDLATHTSGLPALPPNLTTVPGFSLADPYAGYTRADLGAGLADTTLATGPGTEYAYSNYGFALLAQAVRPDFGSLLHELTRSLGLSDTVLRLSAAQVARKVTGHGADGAVVPDWTGRAFAGMGCATYSTVDDMLRYLRGQLAPHRTPFANAIARTQQPHFTVNARLRVGLAWHLSPLPSGRTLVWHNGGTGGFSSFVGCCPESGIGVALLNNIFGVENPTSGRAIDGLGMAMAAELDAARG